MRRTLLLASILLAGSAGLARADYPERPITMIVPFAAGGPTDTVGRLVAEAMTQALGQQVIVENVGGAGGTLGAARVAKADPDGYTVLMYHIGQATSGSLYRKLPYDPVTAFAPIGRVTDVPMTVIARADLAARRRTGADRLPARATRTSSRWPTPARAPARTCAACCCRRAVGVQLTTVPYKGTAPAMTDMLGGQLDLMCDQTTNTTGQIKAGKVKAYAVTTKERVAALADLPTLDEAGLPGFEMSVWHGAVGAGRHPAGGDREAHRGARRGAEGPQGDRALRRPRHRAGPGRSGDAGRPEGADRGRDRQVAADRPGRRRLRRLN